MLPDFINKFDHCYI